MKNFKSSVHRVALQQKFICCAVIQVFCGVYSEETTDLPNESHPPEGVGFKTELVFDEGRNAYAPYVQVGVRGIVIISG